MKILKIVLAAGLVMVVLGVPRPALAQNPGYALKFDGASDFVRLAATPSMMAATWTSTKTVSLWVKPTGSAVCTGPDPGSCDNIFGDRPRSWGIARGTIGGSDRLWVWSYDGTYDKVGIEYTAGVWIHVALVHSGGVLSAYKNGALVGSVASGATSSLGAGAVLHIGGAITNASKNWTFDGEIDEVQLWNSARSATELSQDMNAILGGGESGLAAYYRMTNGSGTSLTDDSGHGWTGTLTDGGSGVPADGPITWVLSGAFGGGGTGNTPPVANPQNVATAEDTALAITLTGSDVDNNPLTFRVVAQPAHGGLTGTAPNVTYTPAANYNGPDSFTFVANDGFVDSAVQTVSITVNPVNDPPVAVADAASTEVDTPMSVAVLSNDIDVDGPSLTITQVTNPPHGIVTNTGSAILYTPNLGYTGLDSFTYTISDGGAIESSALATITVTPASTGFGYALRFDGVSDSVLLGQTSSMMAATWTTTKTIELWVKPTGTYYCNVPGPGSCDAIFGDRPRWWGISRGLNNGLDRIWVWNWDGGLQAIGIDYTVGQWTHIAMVHGGGTLSAYKNGVLVGSMPSGATQQPTTGAFPKLQIGGIINNAQRNWTFEGEIDEVRIWNTAQTADKISLGMNHQLVGTEIGLAAYYQMSDGSGLTVTDDSGHGWIGTFQDGGSGVPADGPILWVVP